MKKKIIVLYSTGGMGHKKAAMALLEAFKAKTDDIEVKAIDSLEYGNKFYNFLYKDMYVYLMSRGKLLWGLLYNFSNLPLVDKVTRGFREKTELSNLGKLDDVLSEENADAIIATHFILPNIAGFLKRKKELRSKLYTVITDNGPHSFWLSDYMDKFFVGSELAKNETLKRGIPETKITVTGIPVMKEFSGSFNRVELEEKYKIDKNKKTIFLLSGGYGVGPLEKMLNALNNCGTDIQAIVVCGHNEKVYKEIESMRKKLKYPVILFGFTDKVAELMAVSDLMITKAGGISTTEALNARLPMILFASIPGQETWNEKLLISAGAAIKAERVEDLSSISDRILLSEDVNQSVREGIDKIRKPYAAREIVDIVIKEVG
jgi:processive 1,2-diacylglycerol beta-glucosyltransferase